MRIRGPMQRFFNILGLISIAIGALIILIYMPFWCWFIATGIIFIVAGIILFKMC